MAANNNMDTLNGLFKTVYADKLQNIIPEGVKLLKAIPFVSKDKQTGSQYAQPVTLGLEHGVSSATSGDAFTLNDSIAGQTKEATVTGSQKVLRSTLSYAAISRALSGGTQAFESSTKYLVGNMLRSMSRVMECELLYGQAGLGSVASVSGTDIVVTEAEWAPGIWAGAENMKIEIFVSAAESSAQRAGTATITAVNMETRTLSLSALPTGTVAGDVIFRFGFKDSESAGLHKIMTNTGPLFGISAATYSLWKGNSYDAAGPLSYAKLTAAISKAVAKGLDQDVKVFVNPAVWDTLVSAEAARRTYDGSYKPGESENGSRALKFHGQNGMIEIEPSIFIKQGYAYVVVMDDLIRVGSSDITFKRPGQGEEFFKDMEGAAGVELRAFCDQALFNFAPGRTVLISGITLS